MGDESTDSGQIAALDALAGVIFGHVGPLTWSSFTEELVQVQLARTILASDWLAGVVAQAKAEGVMQAAEFVRLEAHHADRVGNGRDWSLLNALAEELAVRAAREDGA